VDTDTEWTVSHLIAVTSASLTAMCATQTIGFIDLQSATTQVVRLEQVFKDIHRRVTYRRRPLLIKLEAFHRHVYTEQMHGECK